MDVTFSLPDSHGGRRAPWAVRPVSPRACSYVVGLRGVPAFGNVDGVRISAEGDLWTVQAGSTRYAGSELDVLLEKCLADLSAQQEQPHRS